LSLTIVTKSPSDQVLAQFDRLFVFFGYSSVFHYNHWLPRCNWNTGERMFWCRYHVVLCLVTTCVLVSLSRGFLSCHHMVSCLATTRTAVSRWILKKIEEGY